MELPEDIENKINQLFADADDNTEVKKLIIDLRMRPLNVGKAQLARSILIVSDGRIEKIRDMFQRDFYGDPRDILIMAENKSGNPGHYFIPPFDEIEKERT